MALKTETDAFREDVQQSRKARRLNLDQYQMFVARYHGPHFNSTSGATGDCDYPENHYFQYLSLMLPQLVFESPRVLCSTNHRGEARMVAMALQHGVNEVARRSDMLDTLDELGLDFLLFCSVAMVVQEPHPSLEGPAEYDRHLPRVYRIHPPRFVIDANAEKFKEARYMGHEFIRDLDDLLEEAEEEGSDWDKEALERAKASVGNETGVQAGEGPKRRISTDAREECWLLELWIPEEQLDDEPGPEDGFNGTIRTYAIAPQADNDELIEVREPRMFYGPRTGPYCFAGPHIVPGEIDPLSELVAVESQVQDVNEQARYISTSSKQYKRIVLVDAALKTLQQALAETGDSLIVPIPGIGQMDNKGYIEVEVGGITQQQLAYLELARDRLDRNSGVHDVAKGNIDPDATATAVATAAGSNETRTSKPKARFSRFVVNVLEKIGWYLYHDDRVVFPLNDDAAEELNMKDPWFFGGTYADGSGFTFDDLELRIEPMSMERTSEPMVQARIARVMDMLVALAPVMATTPFIDWPRLLDLVGESLNMPGFEDLVDRKVLSQMLGVNVGGVPQPRIGRLAGTGGQVASMGGTSLPPRSQTPPLLGNLSGANAAQAVPR